VLSVESSWWEGGLSETQLHGVHEVDVVMVAEVVEVLCCLFWAMKAHTQQETQVSQEMEGKRHAQNRAGPPRALRAVDLDGWI